MQEALAETVAMFLRVVLEMSLDKTKDILFMSRLFSGKPGAEAYKQSRNGGATFRERKITRVIGAECGDLVAASSLRHHME